MVLERRVGILPLVPLLITLIKGMGKRPWAISHGLFYFYPQFSGELKV
jgi:hypothetical protein